MMTVERTSQGMFERVDAATSGHQILVERRFERRFRGQLAGYEPDALDDDRAHDEWLLEALDLV